MARRILILLYVERSLKNVTNSLGLLSYIVFFAKATFSEWIVNSWHLFDIGSQTYSLESVIPKDFPIKTYEW